MPDPFSEVLIKIDLLSSGFLHIALLHTNIRFDCRNVRVDLFFRLDASLLIHVKHDQRIVVHNDRIHIVRFPANGFQPGLCALRHAAMMAPIRDEKIKVIGLERRSLNEILHQLWNFKFKQRAYDADAV